MGTPARAHGIGTPCIYLDQGPQRLWPKIGAEVLFI
jgi:hypothetical protein